MINCTVKLRMTAKQERLATLWLWRLTGVYNWAVRKIELDSKQRVYYTRWDIKALLNGHGAKMGMPVDLLSETAAEAHRAWRDCFSKLRGRPKLRGRRNKLNSMVFRHGRCLRVAGRRISGFSALGTLRFNRQDIPEGKVKRIRLVRRSSGWYGVISIDAEPRPVVAGDGQVGIDPGFSNLLTLSTGEKIDRASELAAGAVRLAQAQRGGRKRLTARLQERIGNRRKDRNHKLSRRLVEGNNLIAWSKDSHSKMARRFGKSVTSSGHYQLREMLRYKSRAGGGQFIEVASRNSTKTCSACGALSGPSGLAGLTVRQWVCVTCGVEHDRDCNAAVNTLKAGLGISHESGREAAS